MLAKLKSLPDASAILPFVRMFYAQKSQYLWCDEHGKIHVIEQGEGCEQGDALSPALFSLGPHAALEQAQANLHPQDFLVAYLDDVYILSTRERVRDAHNIVTTSIESLAGIKPHLGKTVCWGFGGGKAPPGIDDLNPIDGEPVWKGDLPPARNGILVLGVPIGSDEFVDTFGANRLAEERSFLNILPKLPNLQCAWLLFYFCAVPRSNHLMRGLPPLQAGYTATRRDEALWEAFCDLLEIPVDEQS